MSFCKAHARGPTVYKQCRTFLNVECNSRRVFPPAAGELVVARMLRDPASQMLEHRCRWRGKTFGRQSPGFLVTSLPSVGMRDAILF